MNTKRLLCSLACASLAASACCGIVGTGVTDCRTTGAAISSDPSATTMSLTRRTEAAILYLDNVSLGSNTFIEVCPGKWDEATSCTYLADPVATVTATADKLIRIETSSFGAPISEGAAAIGLVGDGDAGSARVRVSLEVSD